MQGRTVPNVDLLGRLRQGRRLDCWSGSTRLCPTYPTNRVGKVAKHRVPISLNRNRKRNDVLVHRLLGLRGIQLLLEGLFDVLGSSHFHLALGLGLQLAFHLTLVATLLVIGKPGPGGDQAAHDDVFLEARERVGGATHGRLGEDPCGLLERGRRDEGLGGQGGLGDAEQQRLVFGRVLVLGAHARVFGQYHRVFGLLAAQQPGIAGTGDFYLAQHLAHDDFDMFVVDLHPLQPVNVLNLLDQILGEGRHALEAQDVMGVELAVGDDLALLHALALEDVDVAPLGDQLFYRLTLIHGNDEPLFTLGVLAETDGSRCLGKQGLLLGFAGLEQVCHPRQTTGNVAGLARFLWNPRQHVAHADFGVIGNADDGARGQEVARRHLGTGNIELLVVLVEQLDQGSQVLAVRRALFGVDDHQGGEPRYFVRLALNGNAVDEVFEPQGSRYLGDDRVGMGIPARHHLAAPRHIAVSDLERRAVRDLIALLLQAHLVGHRQLAGPGHGHQVAAEVSHGLDIVEMDGAGGFDLDIVGGHGPGCRATDMEGAHGQLGSGLADGLGGDDAHRLAHVHPAPPGQVATIALGADTDAGLAGDGGTHPHLIDAHHLQHIDPTLVEQGPRGADGFVRARSVDIRRGHPPEDALAQLLDHVAALDDRRQQQTFLGPAVLFQHHHVLGDVHQAPCEVTGVGGLQRRVRQALACAMGGDEVLDDIEPFTEVGGDRRLDDGAVRLGHQTAHTGELADLRRGAAGPGVRHHIDGIE